MYKLHFFYFSLFAFIFSIFVNCVGEPRGVTNWAGSGKKHQKVTSQGCPNPEDLCCRNGMGKCAALIVGCGTIFGLLLCGFGLLWFKMKRYCRTNQPASDSDS